MNGEFFTSGPYCLSIQDPSIHPHCWVVFRQPPRSTISSSPRKLLLPIPHLVHCRIQPIIPILRRCFSFHVTSLHVVLVCLSSRTPRHPSPRRLQYRTCYCKRYRAHSRLRPGTYCFPVALSHGLSNSCLVLWTMAVRRTASRSLQCYGPSVTVRI